jgi:glycosyltransferase involved in cell wall biosynthesis
MSEIPKVTVIIPAHNEAATLQDLLPKLKSHPNVSEVLVINDGSTDNTWDVAEKAGARVITHLVRRGNGAAVKTGLRQASQSLILVMDADGQHSIEDLTPLLNASSDYDLVVGARPFRWSRFRDFGNLTLSRIATTMSGAPVADLTSGLRRVKKETALSFWHMYPEGFSFPTTSTMLFLTSGYSVCFLPIPNRPRPRHASPSKLHPLSEGFRFLSLIYRIVLLSYPLRFFAPVGITLILLGMAWTVRTVHKTAQISAGGALLFLSGLTILLFGTVADQLSQIRRSISRAE